jgi:antitoxin ParD1/3/4
MTIVLDLPRETAERLRAEAAAKGIDEAELLRSLLEQRYSARVTPFVPLTDEEFEAALDELADITDAATPKDRQPLSDYAVSRAGIYEDDEYRR